jgi:hypothetical protein
MTADKDCVDYARECIRLATLAKDSDIREHLLQLARDWIAQAERERRRAITAAKAVALS